MKAAEEFVCVCVVFVFESAGLQTCGCNNPIDIPHRIMKMLNVKSVDFASVLAKVMLAGPLCCFELCADVSILSH